MTASAILLAGPPSPGLDLLRAALRLNRPALRRLGVDFRPGAEPSPEEGCDRRLLVANTPGPARLAALRAESGDLIRAIAYVEPPHAAILSRVERDLVSGKPLDRQFRNPRPLTYRALLDRYDAAFGADRVDIRISGPSHLPGQSMLEDFWAAAALPGDCARLDLASLRPVPRLSLEGASILDRLTTNHAKHLDPKRDRRVAAALVKLACGYPGRPFSLPQDHVDAVLEMSGDDISWLTRRVGEAALAEPRPRPLEPAWAMHGAAIDGAAAIMVRLARQSAERRAAKRPDAA